MIDWQRATELQQEIGDDGFLEVVELFLDEVEAVLMRLRTAPDPARYEDDMHFLKGSALNLGFSGLGAMCRTGERHAAEGRTSEVDIPAVLECYSISKQAFMAGAGQLGLTVRVA